MAQTLCPKCGKGFKTETGLGWHMERYHPGPRPAILAQNEPSEAETAWQAEREEIREQLAVLDTGLEAVARDHRALDGRMGQWPEKMMAETKEKLSEWIEVRMSDLLRQRLAPIEQRLNSLESEQRVLTSRDDSQERRLDTLDRRISALEPKPQVCTLSRRHHCALPEMGDSTGKHILR